MYAYLTNISCLILYIYLPFKSKSMRLLICLPKLHLFDE